VLVGGTGVDMVVSVGLGAGVLVGGLSVGVLADFIGVSVGATGVAVGSPDIT
jgi:hypothetical protein